MPWPLCVGAWAPFGASVPALSVLSTLLGVAGPHAPHGHEREPRPRIMVLTAPGPEAVLIRGGEFRMGSTVEEVAAAREQCAEEPRGEDCANRDLFPSLFADELDSHIVVLGDFWIDRTEVTEGDYGRCVAVGVCRPPGGPAAIRWASQPDTPVTLVSWDDANAYCRWRGSRLPTEAEWERVARGWAGRRYPWGEVFNRSLVNHGRFAWDPHDSSDGFATVAPVGSFESGATPDRVVDMAGNVEEWVADWYAPSYSPERAADPRGPDAGDVRVVRGGSYQSAAPWLRGAARSFDLPSRQRAWRGFRCARDHGPRPTGPVGDP